MQIVIAVIELVMSIVYALLSLGAKNKFSRVAWFVCSVMCMVVGVANLM